MHVNLSPLYRKMCPNWIKMKQLWYILFSSLSFTQNIPDLYLRNYCLRSTYGLYIFVFAYFHIIKGNMELEWVFYFLTNKLMSSLIYLSPSVKFFNLNLSITCHVTNLHAFLYFWMKFQKLILFAWFEFFS